jgi:hypothetical protein
MPANIGGTQLTPKRYTHRKVNMSYPSRSQLIFPLEPFRFDFNPYGLHMIECI